MFACYAGWTKRVFAIIVIITISNFVNAQEDKLNPEVDNNTGLTSNAIRCIKVVQVSSVYVGTDNGLNILGGLSIEQTNIIRDIGGVSIWGLEIWKGLLFVGTRNAGLRIYNLSSGKLYKYISTNSINQIRKIKTLNDSVFILTNNGTYLWGNDNLRLVKLIKPSERSFIIDMFEFQNKAFGIIYPESQIVEYNAFEFSLNLNKKFLGKDKPSDFYSFAATSDSSNVILTSCFDKKRILYFSNPHTSTVNKKYVFNNVPEGYIIWDIIKYKNKIILAFGDTYSNEKGFIYVKDLQNNFESITPSEYITALAIDSANDMLYYGSLTSGLYCQKGISHSTSLDKPIKSKLYSNDEGNITFSGEMGTYQYKEGNLFSLNNYSTNSIPTFQSVCYFGDTVIVSSNKDIKAYDSKKLKEIKGVITQKPYLLNVIATTNSLNKNGDKYIFRFNHYGWVSQYNLKTGLDTLIHGIDSNIPSTIKQNGKIVLFNKEKGFNIIDGNDAYPLFCSNEKIPFARDFAIIKDTIFVLIRNSIEVFVIDYSIKQMVAIRSINIHDLCDGFEEEWILSKDNELYLANNKGLLQINVSNGTPLNYYWIGNNSKIQKPIIAGQQIIWSTDKMLSVVPFKEIEGTTQSKYEYNGNLKFPDNLNENLEFKSEFSCSQYVVQEHSLKSIELLANGKLLLQKFTINKYFNFPTGLKYGTYEWILHAGNQAVNGKLYISLPLNRNPNFYWTIIALIIVILAIVVKYWFDRKVANKTLLQNQLQILKQNFNPHFIYNSMNLISSLILERKLDESVEVIHDLSNLQRMYLESNNKDEISLEEEIHFLDMYLNLQQKRFEQDKAFSYQYFIDNSISIKNILLPPLILQPIAENAVKYGVVSSKALIRTIYLDILKEGESYIIRIEDNGEMMDASKNELGIGLSLVKKRLELYNKMHKKNLSIIYGLKPTHNDSGYRVELIIPEY